MRRGGGVRIGARINKKVVGAFRADDETLLSVKEEVIAFVFGGGSGAEKVGTAARFGEAFGGEDLPAQQRRDIARLLRVGPVQHDRVADQIGAHAEDTGKFVAEAADFLADCAGSDPIQSFAAPLDRVAHAQQLALSGLAQPLPGEAYFFLVHVQDKLTRSRIHEIARRIPRAALFFIQQMVEHEVLQARSSMV